MLKMTCDPIAFGTGASKLYTVSSCWTYQSLCYARAQEKVGSKGLSNQKIRGKFPYGKARETGGTQ